MQTPALQATVHQVLVPSCGAVLVRMSKPKILTFPLEEIWQVGIVPKMGYGVRSTRRLQTKGWGSKQFSSRLRVPRNLMSSPDGVWGGEPYAKLNWVHSNLIRETDLFQLGRKTGRPITRGIRRLRAVTHKKWCDFVVVGLPDGVSRRVVRCYTIWTTAEFDWTS